MKQLILFFSMAVLPALTFAQTKRIAHKSHSGTEETFLAAYENNLFGMEYDNEGLNESAYFTPAPRLLVTDTLIRSGSSLIPADKNNLKIDPLFNPEPSLTDTVRKFFKQGELQLPILYLRKKDTWFLMYPPIFRNRLQ